MDCFSFLQKRQLCITSPLECTGKRRSPEARCCVTSKPWRGFCPNCSRPIDVAVQKVKVPKPVAQQRHAYVITLWGASPSYVLGALVLGRSIRNVGSTKDMIVLHTRDVQGVDLLRRTGWITKQVEHVESVTKLFSDPNRGRFDHVFTKLHAINLTQYDKICMLDIDMLVMHNIDDVFDIPAPAAMRRGQAHVGHTYEHAQCVEGETFFAGGYSVEDNVLPGGDWQTWGQAAGINAGLMVLQPDEEVFRNMIAEVADPNHPSHIAGNGPEQDYLSRYYADQWRHISIAYNFQLHQLYFSLHPKDQYNSIRANLCREGLSAIKVIHYSGDKGLKPWDYVAQLAEKGAKNLDDFVESVLEGFQGYLLWSMVDKETWEYLMECKHFSIAYLEYRDGRIYWDNGVEAIVPWNLKVAARNIVQVSFERWVTIYNELQSELNMCIVQELSDRVQPDTSASDSNGVNEVFKVTRIKCLWSKSQLWWSLSSNRLKEDEYRLIISADEYALGMIYPHGRFRSNSSIIAACIPHPPVAFENSEALHAWAKSIPLDAFVSVALKHPTADTMKIVSDMGATFPIPEEDEMPRGYFVCCGVHGRKYGTDWNCLIDIDLAVIQDVIHVPAELIAELNVDPATEPQGSCDEVH